MPRYYFHLKDHVNRVLDVQGQVIDDEDEVYRAALKEARAIISHEALDGSINLDQQIEVKDEGGQSIHILSFADAVKIKSAQSSK